MPTVSETGSPSHARTVLLAGGGSGGHISPALAIAERLPADVASLVVCSDRAIDTHMLGSANVEHVPVAARPPSFRPRRAVGFVRSWRRSRSACGRLLESRRPDLVVALGGFVAAPAVAAARAHGVPVALMNLDAPPGGANQWIARRCQTVWSAAEVPELRHVASLEVTGLPLRRAALAPAPTAECRQAFALDPERPVLLVTGASQGARSINDLLEAIARRRASMLDGWQILHVCGRDADAEGLRGTYDESGIDAHVVPFVDQMGLAWGAAELAVSRSGANSVAEVAANAVPTLFLPYPFHRDRHQHHNAEPLVQAGAALREPDLVETEANLERAARTLEGLLADAATRDRLRERLKAVRAPDAASRVVECLLAEIRYDR